MHERVWTELFCQKPCSRGIVWSCGSLLEYRSGFLPRAAERARCQISLARRSRGQASPPAHPTKPFMFPNRRPRAAPHSYCSTNACVCLIPETWWQWPPCHEWKKCGLVRSVLCLLLIFILNFLFLSCLSFSLLPPVPILVCVSLIITFWYWCFPEVTDHRFSCHMCFFFSLFPLFITLSFSALYVT